MFVIVIVVFVAVLVGLVVLIGLVVVLISDRCQCFALGI